MANPLPGAGASSIQCQQVQPRPGHIITERPFGNFRLSFEWKISPEGNGGLKYRVRKYDGKWRGCEYQVLDDLAYRKSILPRKSAGALYDLYAPNENKHLRPVGAFNSSEIFVEHNRIQHWLNGKLILSASVGDEDWKQRVAESKFHDLPEFGRNQIGRIMLTDHDSATWYRNFRFQALPINPSRPPQL